MKKIIALILALACVFALAACGKDPEPEKSAEEIAIEATLVCYAASAPTKVVTKTSRDFDGYYKLDGEYVLVTGKIDGKIATVRTYVQDMLRTIEEGSGADIMENIYQVKGSEEYLEDKGFRTNGGAWMEDGLNFAPTAGSLAISITKNNITDITYTESKYNNVLSFTVPEDKVDEVFGVDEEGDSFFDHESDIKVVITNNGAVITGITIEYAIEADDEYPGQQVSIITNYTYELEAVTLVK